MALKTEVEKPRWFIPKVSGHPPGVALVLTGKGAYLGGCPKPLPDEQVPAPTRVVRVQAASFTGLSHTDRPDGPHFAGTAASLAMTPAVGAVGGVYIPVLLEGRSAGCPILLVTSSNRYTHPTCPPARQPCRGEGG